MLLAAHQGIRRVCDPTCGSGSSLVACVDLGISAVGIELVSETADLARQRVLAAKINLGYSKARVGQKGLFARAAP